MNRTFRIAAIAAFVAFAFSCKGKEFASPTSPTPNQQQFITLVLRVEGPSCRPGARVDVKLVDASAHFESPVFVMPIGQSVTVGAIPQYGHYVAQYWYDDAPLVVGQVTGLDFLYPTSSVTVTLPCPAVKP